MEFFTTINFVRKYGFEKFKLFSEMMNSGASLKDMSDAIGLSMSQLSRYRDAMFEVRYVPKRGTQKAIEECASLDEMRADAKRSTILQFVEVK